MYAAHYKAPFAKDSIRLMANEAPLFIWVFFGVDIQPVYSVVFIGSVFDCVERVIRFSRPVDSVCNRYRIKRC